VIYAGGSSISLEDHSVSRGFLPSVFPLGIVFFCTIEVQLLPMILQPAGKEKEAEN
jgi:hypothetical protein